MVLSQLEPLRAQYDEWASAAGAPVLARTQTWLTAGLPVLMSTSGSITCWHPADAALLSLGLSEVENRDLADGVTRTVMLFAAFLHETGLWSGSADALFQCLTLVEPGDECSCGCHS